MPSRFDPATARQFVAALRPGAVLHLLQPFIGKHKFHVLISATVERSIGFLINTLPSPFVQNRPDLLRRHLLMPVSTHPFMRHDSFIACDDTVKLPARDQLIAGLCDRTIEQVGYVSRTLFPAMVAAAEGSRMIATRDAELLRQAFTR